jgi:hypothetical protein
MPEKILFFRPEGITAGGRVRQKQTQELISALHIPVADDHCLKPTTTKD